MIIDSQVSQSSIFLYILYNFSYEELVINFPIAEIISYEPQEPIEGEVLTLTGKVTAEGQSIVQHYWGVIPLQDGQEIGDETQIGSAAILSTQELAAGEWRFVYQHVFF